ncbi:MAG: formate--tetrahydrofolate ligase [Candidatus Marinimicrobia bacterium]|nr:formate--tetrahydrofolate ligase [Candidatus Neomarinimicrobiota bacterium]
MNNTNNLPKRKIREVVRELGLSFDDVFPHGHYIAKIPIEHLKLNEKKKDGKLILVTAMTPTPKGEGKTTTTIGLGDALRCLGYKSSICLREPSLGPYFGIKGGGTGAGKSQIVPSEDINLHFVGDMYSVSKANNLLAALIDNHLYHGNELGIDPRRIIWKRVIDLNDRALREILVGLGGVRHGIPRPDGFVITPASEVMAMLCLASDFEDLGRRLSNALVAFTYKGEPVYVRDIRAEGAMQVLLRDAIHPNLVQTMEGTPAFVHGGPFANIAQGTNSIIATRMALKLTDYVVTEAGFGTDLGGEKFFHIKCRIANLKPDAVVIVTTVRAIKHHGGFTEDGGLGNLAKHIENIRFFGLNPVVAINRFKEDTGKDIDKIIEFCENEGVRSVVTNHYQEGGKGAVDLAKAVLKSIEENKNYKFTYLYPLDMSIEHKIERIAKKIYGAIGVDFDRSAETDIELINRHGFSNLPICIAKTHKSLSDNPKLLGRPRKFKININELRIAAGAGFIVAIAGNILTMPGLPKEPVAVRIKVMPDGRTIGLV